MTSDRTPRSGQVPLPGFSESASTEVWVPLPGSSRNPPADRTAQSRAEGLRRVRRMSNWTAAALIVGTGATAVALAHNAVPISPPMATPGTSTTTGTSTAAVTHGTSGPQVGHTVATTSASGVTTTTTTQVVNGKTVVTHSRNAPAYHDD